MAEKKTAEPSPALAIEVEKQSLKEWFNKREKEVAANLDELEDNMIAGYEAKLQARIDEAIANINRPVDEFPLQSPAIDQLVPAMVVMQKNLKDPEKNRTASVEYRSGAKTYNYADLQECLSKFRECGPAAGLSLSFRMKPYTQTHLLLVTQLTHDKSSQWFRTYWEIPKNLSAQQKGSELTYGKRYSLDAIIAMAGEEDDDGSAANEAGKPGAPQTPPKTPPKQETSKAPPAKQTPPPRPPAASPPAATPVKEVEPDVDVIPDDPVAVGQIIFETGIYKGLRIHDVWARKRANAIATCLQVAKSQAARQKVPNKYLALVDYGLVKNFIAADFANQ